MNDPINPVTVEQRHRQYGIEADDGAIATARALADRQCGATQTEMRDARKVFLAKLFAQFEASIASTDAPVAEGEGLIRVPRNPTDEMVHAGLYQLSVGGDEWAMVYQIWTDMFTAITMDGGLTSHLLARHRLASQPQPTDELENVVQRSRERSYEASLRKIARACEVRLTSDVECMSAVIEGTFRAILSDCQLAALSIDDQPTDDRLAIAVAALEPFAKLRMPAKCEGNAAFYSILHAQILAARQALTQIQGAKP